MSIYSEPCLVGIRKETDTPAERAEWSNGRRQGITNRDDNVTKDERPSTA